MQILLIDVSIFLGRRILFFRILPTRFVPLSVCDQIGTQENKTCNGTMAQLDYAIAFLEHYCAEHRILLSLNDKSAVLELEDQLYKVSRESSRFLSCTELFEFSGRVTWLLQLRVVGFIRHRGQLESRHRTSGLSETLPQSNRANGQEPWYEQIPALYALRRQRKRTPMLRASQGCDVLQPQ